MELDHTHTHTHQKKSAQLHPSGRVLPCPVFLNKRCFAPESGRCSMLELRTALAKKIPVDSLDPWGDTALHLATRVGLLLWEEFLLLTILHVHTELYRNITSLPCILIVSTVAVFVIGPVHTSIYQLISSDWNITPGHDPVWICHGTSVQRSRLLYNGAQAVVLDVDANCKIQSKHKKSNSMQFTRFGLHTRAANSIECNAVIHLLLILHRLVPWMCAPHCAVRAPTLCC